MRSKHIGPGRNQLSQVQGKVENLGWMQMGYINVATEAKTEFKDERIICHHMKFRESMVAATVDGVRRLRSEAIWVFPAQAVPRRTARNPEAETLKSESFTSHFIGGPRPLETSGRSRSRSQIHEEGFMKPRPMGPTGGIRGVAFLDRHTAQNCLPSCCRLSIRKVMNTRDKANQ